LPVPWWRLTRQNLLREIKAGKNSHHEFLEFPWG